MKTSTTHRGFLWSVCSIVVVWGIQVCAQAPPLFFWHTSNEVSTVYLLGTIHVGHEGMYPLDPKIEEAFRASDTLVVELDIHAIDPVQVQQKMMYTPPASLRDALSEEVYEQLTTYFVENYGIPASVISQMKPGLAVITLVMLKMQEFGYDPQWGVDTYLLNTRRDQNLVALETLDFQISLFEALGEEVIAKELDKLDDMEDMFNRMVAAWESGDMDTLEEIITEGFDDASEELYELMFTKRNHAMTEKIQELIEEPGTYFVAVGAGHMIGDDGIVALLSETMPVTQVRSTPVARGFIFAPPSDDE